MRAQSILACGTTLGDLRAAGVNVEKLFISIHAGDIMYDNSRKSGDFFGNTFGDNTAFQSDNTTQVKTISENSNEFQTLFQNLLEDISQLQDEEKREQAEFNAEQFRTAAENGDSMTAQKILKFLGRTLGNVGSLASIASLYGITI